MRGYAVDVETTGLYAGGHHRVIEVAVVHVDPSGGVTSEWATLANPRRDLGPAVRTMRMAVDFLPGPPRSLAACCRAASVTLNDQHEALSDARAAAGLLACYLAKAGTPPP